MRWSPSFRRRAESCSFASAIRSLRRTGSAENAQGRASVERGQQFELLVQSVTDYAIYMLDTGGRVTSWNAGARRFKGYEAHEIIGEHFSGFYTPEEREQGIPRIALETAAREGRFETEGWRVRKDGPGSGQAW